ncbi:MAG: DUF1749 domain-containing protein [Candidatus Roizmanbacteria bacterium]|nr:DUF1749 domain-containing protein [Candidatus Roizmanbacteria bacterium]
MTPSTVSLVELEATDGVLLPGLLYEPTTPTKKACLYIHGNGSSSVFYSPSKQNSLGQQLNKEQISYFPFNNRGAHYIKKLRKNTYPETRILAGMAYEQIKECVYDIDGAIDFLRKKGYTTFYLAGSSTGANKICIYNYYTSTNPCAGYILISGGDDAGLFYNALGEKKYNEALKNSYNVIRKGKGDTYAPLDYTDGMILTYTSLYDTIHPDGDYNIFPYYEHFNNLHLSKKSLFREFRSITLPTLVVYGEEDEYCYNKVPEIVALLKKKVSNSTQFKFTIIPQANHGFDGKESELNTAIINWIKRN